MSRRLALLALVAGLAAPARADVRDRWEVTLVPPPSFDMETADIYNPLGHVTVRGWDRQEVRIVAEKQAATPALMKHIKVLAGFCTDGSVCVKTYVIMAEGQKALPIAMGRIDLVMDIPRRLPLKARTFVGDLEASGLRAGAQLESKSGAIRVRDVHGAVVTRALRGNQTVAAVEGSVDLDGVAGDLDLMQVSGQRLSAKTVDGSIRVHKVRAEVVRLATTAGEIWLLDLSLVPGGRYELSTFDGSIRVRPAAPASFELQARMLRGKFVTKRPLTMRTRTTRMVRALSGQGGAHLMLTASGDVSLE
ncbi:MAG TPA: hypothetical protein VGQ83_28245 [Polyangia bacterium]|jgi:hypothetical protein